MDQLWTSEHAHNCSTGLAHSLPGLLPQQNWETYNEFYRLRFESKTAVQEQVGIRSRGRWFGSRVQWWEGDFGIAPLITGHSTREGEMSRRPAFAVHGAAGSRKIGQPWGISRRHFLRDIRGKLAACQLPMALSRGSSGGRLRILRSETVTTSDCLPIPRIECSRLAMTQRMKGFACEMGNLWSLARDANCVQYKSMMPLSRSTV